LPPLGSITAPWESLMVAPRQQSLSAFGGHGRKDLPRVEVCSYNIEIRDHGHFLGDRASKAAFREKLEHWRLPLVRAHHDPFQGRKISPKAADKAWESADAAGTAMMLGAIEDFSQDFAAVIRRFLRQKSWHGVRRIAVGGGMRGRRVGQLIIERTAQILAADGSVVDLVPIAGDPDDAGLTGALGLLPEWIFRGYRAILAADIGGTNIRTGLVRFHFNPRLGFSGIRVTRQKKWKHCEKKVSRDEAVAKLITLLKGTIAYARKARLPLAPVVGIACPGIITPEGGIDRGTQNLPGNWSARGFRLPDLVSRALPDIDGRKFHVVLHNDAVVQGLSEIPRMRDVDRWGVLTLGTGLGNASFRNL
jgi:hypothetical protein